MKYTFDKNIPYKFKEITGLEEEWKVGSSIFEDGNVIGGIAYQEDQFPAEGGGTVECLSICGIEILSEFRNQGKGTFIIKDLLKKYDFINAAVQDEKAWKWWKSLGAQVYLTVAFPEDIGKENPKVHTLCFVLGQNFNHSLYLRHKLTILTQSMPGATQITTMPEIDFSKNKQI